MKTSKLDVTPNFNERQIGIQNTIMKRGKKRGIKVMVKAQRLTIKIFDKMCPDCRIKMQLATKPDPSDWCQECQEKTRDEIDQLKLITEKIKRDAA